MLKKLLKKINSVVPDWINMEEPESIQLILERHGVIIDDIYDFLMALKCVCTNYLAWEDPFVFENIVDAFNNDPVIPETISKPPLENIMYAVHLLDEFSTHEFSDNIAKYIAAVAYDSGYYAVPEPISFANKYIPDSEDNIKIEATKLASDVADIDADFPFEEKPLDIQAAKILALWISYKRKTEGEH
jgi:hypothetical protein